MARSSDLPTFAGSLSGGQFGAENAGQFAAEIRGQFAAESTGQFEAEFGGPFRRIFHTELQGYPTHPSQEGAIARATSSILKTTRENGITAQYMSYCSSEFSGWQNAYWCENYGRLQEVKKRYDPKDRIAHPQSVRVSQS
jgi:hypothetical protein